MTELVGATGLDDGTQLEYDSTGLVAIPEQDVISAFDVFPDEDPFAGMDSLIYINDVPGYDGMYVPANSPLL